MGQSGRGVFPNFERAQDVATHVADEEVVEKQGDEIGARDNAFWEFNACDVQKQVPLESPKQVAEDKHRNRRDTVPP
ncbi:MAG: hypothetical protein BWY06_02384 [Candidatus Latescibacteria bacterium ADurb.Bin168]|nr:MAG: hypothetical protein BWY06_02384 [Candidatus Latescibacteria bacterium ADurb.Bin168]